MKKSNTAAPAPRRAAPIPQAGDGIGELPDGEQRVQILGTTHAVRRTPGRGDGHEVRVQVGRTGGGGRELRAERTFVLDSAATVAELRRYFAQFDFPVLDAGELDEACARARHGTLRVRMSTGEDGRRTLEFLERIPEESAPTDRRDASHIWNHRRHWQDFR